MGTTVEKLQDVLPRGVPLQDEVWERRNRAFVILLWAHVIALPLFGIIRGQELLHSVLEGGVIAIPAVVASSRQLTRGLRAVAATIGLMTCSGILVHFAGGVIEAHFHFFVIVTLVSLYQMWIPYLVGIAYVVLHHAILGTIAPESVFNHPAAQAKPWTWAFIHGGFILGASIAGLVVWKRNEELYEALDTRLDEQIRLNKTLDEFGGRVAHDLKTPLATIGGAAEMLSMPGVDPTHQERLIEMITRQSYTANAVVTGLLRLARASGTPHPEPIDLRDLVEDVAEPHDLLIELEGGAPTIVADPVAMRQAVANLFENASRYARSKEAPIVTVGCDRSDEGWIISVADRGPGVTEEDAADIFEPFRRGSHEESTGTGLGLAIVGATAAAHGGRAWYEPREGGGSRFCLLIPDNGSTGGSPN